jgi:hypothetical protein
MSVTSIFLDLYNAKTAEYILSMFYLGVFFPAMWDYIQGKPEPVPKVALREAWHILKEYFAVHHHV